VLVGRAWSADIRSRSPSRLADATNIVGRPTKSQTALEWDAFPRARRDPRHRFIFRHPFARGETRSCRTSRAEVRRERRRSFGCDDARRTRLRCACARTAVGSPCERGLERAHRVSSTGARAGRSRANVERIDAAPRTCHRARRRRTSEQRPMGGSGERGCRRRAHGPKPRGRKLRGHRLRDGPHLGGRRRRRFAASCPLGARGVAVCADEGDAAHA
jgi:hypothetical protein